MGAGRWIGRGDKNAADQAAVDAMRAMLDTVVMDGVVVIGEGEKDEAPMLFNGERVGHAGGPEVDVAVDPLEGTRLAALGQPNAIAVIAAADRGSMFFPGAAVYMEKIAVGADAIDAIDITASPTENVNAVAKAKGRRVTDIRVVVLERDRHDELIGELRQAGARVNLIRDGDVAPAIAAARPGTGVDMLYGIGGTPEGVISAAALKSRRRRHPGAAVAARRRRTRAAGRRRTRSRRRPDHRRPRKERQRVRRRDRRDDRSAAPRRPLRARRSRHRLDRHALAVGHGAADRGAPPADEAGPLHGPGVLSRTPTLAADNAKNDENRRRETRWLSPRRTESRGSRSCSATRPSRCSPTPARRSTRACCTCPARTSSTGSSRSATVRTRSCAACSRCTTAGGSAAPAISASCRSTRGSSTAPARASRRTLRTSTRRRSSSSPTRAAATRSPRRSASSARCRASGRTRSRSS